MRIGVFGAGQLGMMLAEAGIKIGHTFRFIAPERDSVAAKFGEQVVSSYTDPEGIQRFARDIDLATFEFENIDPAALDLLPAGLPVHPCPRSLIIGQNRLLEKEYFRGLGIGHARFAGHKAGSSKESLRESCEALGFPLVLKTCRFGYDGKGQVLLSTPQELEQVDPQLLNQDLILEEFVPFDREISAIAARSRAGKIAFYPLVQNVHRNGILVESRAPAPNASRELKKQAQVALTRMLQDLDYCGVLAIEFFECSGKLLANEFAPRVHNSGHWTIEGCRTSQFENHIRAISGAELGDAAPLGLTRMFNLIGRLPDLSRISEVPAKNIHIYGKSPRPGRKLGHITVVAASEDELLSRSQGIEQCLIGCH
ncbi:MAG: 5-(carboxyamino)imidazole ribonucleotide synthase [Proteobacteria bacterium]|nr:MAG: 5-(carboxyamino)imidazole ribonucleotide synthase [Pseudomonadota bacterium]